MRIDAIEYGRAAYIVDVWGDDSHLFFTRLFFTAFFSLHLHGICEENVFFWIFFVIFSCDVIFLFFTVARDT